MDKFFKIVALFAVAASCLAACNKEERNTEPLVDPWTREKTPVNFRLENQIGAATITSNWRDDSVGGIHVSMITGGLDMTKVKIVALDFEFPESEFCPTASVKVGDTIDLSSGSTAFTVTAYNGEVRTYTVDYEQFKDPLEGVYVHHPISGIIDGSVKKSSMVIYGGWTDAVVLSTDQDKSWQWGSGYQPLDEQDNTVSFLLTAADSETGLTEGTVVNTSGENGLYSNYMFQNKRDVGVYRQVPVGASRWKKDASGMIHFYAKDDTACENELWVISIDNFEKLNEVAAIANKTPDLGGAGCCFWRDCHFDPANEVIDNNWPDSRWMADNLRNTFWIMDKTSDSALENHDDLFEQL